MKSLACVLALVAIAAIPRSAFAAPPPPETPSLSVTGNGTIQRMPDQTTVSLTLVTDDGDEARATSANNATYQRLLGRLQALGLPASALHTTSYTVRYNPRPQRPNPQFTDRYGYIVTRGVTVTSDRTDRAGAIVDAAVGAGVSDVGTIAFGIKDRSAAYRAALAAAVADAQAQARALADAAHVRLLRIIAIAPQTTIPFRVPLATARAEAAPAVPTEIQPSELTVQANVTVTYAIAQ